MSLNILYKIIDPVFLNKCSKSDKTNKIKFHQQRYAKLLEITADTDMNIDKHV